MTTEKQSELLAKWDARVIGTVLAIDKIETAYTSGHHPFTIGPEHVAHASDHCCGLLGDETLRAIPCSHCHKSYDDIVHHGDVACYLRVTRKCTQAEVTAILFPLKEEMTKDGIEVFAFVNHQDITDWGQKR